MALDARKEGKVSPKTKPITLDAYLRVSKVAGREGESFISPDVQLEQIEQWAKLRGVKIAKVHKDLDVSGGKLHRPGLDALMERIRKGETGGIAVAKLDRLSRASVADALNLVEEINDHGGVIAAVDLGIDPATPFGEFAMTIMLALARMERQRITASWDDATTRAIERGVHIGHGQHHGFTKDADGRLHVDPVQSLVVRDIFRRRAQRQTWSSIARWLEEEHPRDNGLHWTHQTVRSTVRNRIYTGAAFFGDKLNPDAHEPIVTLAEFDAANAVEGGRTASPNARPQPLLAGILRCAGCRYVMTKVNDPDGNIRGYKCNRKQTTGECPDPAWVTSDEIERLAVWYFGWWHFQAKRQPYRPDLTAVEDAEAKLADLERRLALVAEDDARLEALGPERFNRDLARRSAEIERARVELDKARAAVEQDSNRPILLEDEWDTLSQDERHAIMRRGIDSIYVKRGDEPLGDRVWFRWAGEDTLDRPRRGGRPPKNGKPEHYVIEPVPWPVTHNELEADRSAMSKANIPQFAKDRIAKLYEQGWGMELGLDVPEELQKAFAQIRERQ